MCGRLQAVALRIARPFAVYHKLITSCSCIAEHVRRHQQSLPHLSVNMRRDQLVYSQERAEPARQRELSVGRTWHCRPQDCIGLTVVNLTRPASCAATALPSCFPPSGNRAASTWRLRSSSADASEDAFFVAAPPELVCLCSSSLWRARACGLGSETSASARGVLWTYGVRSLYDAASIEVSSVPGGAGVGREAAPLEQLIRGVSCCKAQVVGLLLLVANDEPSS